MDSEIDDHLDQASEAEGPNAMAAAGIRMIEEALTDEADQFKPAADEVAREIQYEPTPEDGGEPTHDHAGRRDGGVEYPTDRKELEQKIADRLGQLKILAWELGSPPMVTEIGKLELLFAELGIMP